MKYPCERKHAPIMINKFKKDFNIGFTLGLIFTSKQVLRNNGYHGWELVTKKLLLIIFRFYKNYNFLLMKKIFFVSLFISALFFKTAFSGIPPKYIFVFIGDGMGLNQVFLTEKYLEYFKDEKLIFLDNSWKFGLTKTDCLDTFRITDSGAAGTAIACGEKTNYGMIGMSKYKSFESIAEYLKKQKFKIGILTSVPLNHATPAAFFGHEPTRKNYDNLTNELIKSHFDFFAGGGFMLGNADTSKRIYKNFEQVLLKLKENKYNLLLNTSLLDKNKNTVLPVIIIDTLIRNKQINLKNVYSDEKNALPNVIDFPGYEDKLSVYTETAINSLKNDTGFFIMVEGGKIDWACHDNDAATAVGEVIAFNDAVKKAYGFYLKNPENTLIIVTADHETGGLTLGRGFDDSNSSSINSYRCYPNKLTLQKKSLIFSDSVTVAKYNYDAQIGWTTNEHSGLPVGIWTIGQGCENFTGIFENSDIKSKILNLINIQKR
ncbi:MAG TPA: alkaline phosphatase [Bacteroidales bacterium]|nr:alkaline phosphatase [Bacteroidales bacterium]HPS17154.1 alkaline phosphatase [Bacteroidales bacterium]